LSFYSLIFSLLITAAISFVLHNIHHCRKLSKLPISI